ncbi:response regulator transcription factor [Mucilaginibacter sp.]
MTINKILIADDDPGIVDVLRLMLELEGYEVSHTYTGDILLNLIGNMPDLILLDINLGHHDGRLLCRALKSADETRNIPVLMISANYNIDASARESGADDFVPKPFDMTDLLTKVANLLHRNAA